MNNRILAVVVTYYPEKELFEKNISFFINYVDKIMIWENTPVKEKERYRYVVDNKIDYCGDGVNSISRGLNYAWEYANKKGYKYLLTMDQDSLLFNIGSMLKYIFSHPSELMILGPTLSEIDSAKSSPEVFKREKIITSGMLVPVKVLDILRGYNENLKIDGIDTDLCLRAKLQGIPVYQVTGCFLQQRFGQPLVYNGKKTEIISYPAKRLRSILRAHVYLMRKYSNMSNETKKEIVNNLIKNRIKVILRYEDKRIIKLYNFVMGIIEGFLMKV